MLDIKDVSIGILAGGKATRMQNQDKGLVNAKGKPLVENILNKISAHTSNIFINANRNIDKYKKYNYPVVKDIFDDFQGPLSGIYSMLKKIDTKYLISVPCDCPNFDWYVIKKIINDADKSNELCIAHNTVRSQPVFMLVSISKIKSLYEFLYNGDRKIDIWYQNNNHKYIYFDKNDNYFENINTIEQLNEYNKS